MSRDGAGNGNDGSDGSGAKAWTWRFLFYPSTLVVWVRLGLVAAALVILQGAPAWSVDNELLVLMFAVSRLLDLADGPLARRFGHANPFGASLDLVADLITHSVLWMLSGYFFAYGLIALEWTAGLGILNRVRTGETAWKETLIAEAPGWVRAYFANNQRNLLCACASVAHFLLPASALMLQPSVLIVACLAPGVLVYEAATVYLIKAAFRRSETHDSLSPRM